MAGYWKRALLYLGLVEEDDDLEPLAEMHEPPQLETVRPIRPDVESSTVRRVGPPATTEYAPAPTMGVTPMQSSPMIIPPLAKIHVVDPRSFNDAKEIGDHLKGQSPVLVNLQQVEPDLRKRLVDFSAGLTYGLSGTIQKVADRVFLLTPANVEVSAEETQRIISERGFFNQF